MEKTSQREKYIGIAAVVGVAAAVVSVLAPELERRHAREEALAQGGHRPRGDVLRPGTVLLPSQLAAQRSAANLQAEASAAPAAPVRAGMARRVYPFSIVPGGAYTREELAQAISADPVVAEHYANFNVAKAQPFIIEQGRAAYVSYRKGDQIFWTKKKLWIKAGETLMTDGRFEMRARCANRISDVPQLPVEEAGPSERVLDSFEEIQMAALEDTEPGSNPAMMAIAANAGESLGAPASGRHYAQSFPNGAGLLQGAASGSGGSGRFLAPPAPRIYSPSVNSLGTIGGGTEGGGSGGGGTPGGGGEPGGTPGTPGTPDTPRTPDSPDTPDTPRAPDSPDTPDPSDPPGQPPGPDTPDVPPRPDTPDGPPPGPDTPGTPDTPPPRPPEGPGNPDDPDEPYTPGPPAPPGTTPGNPAPVPEPGSWALMGIALAALALARRRS